MIDHELLVQYILNGDVDSIRQQPPSVSLLNQKVSFQSFDLYPLSIACLHSDSCATVQLLLDLGAQLNQVCEFGSLGQAYPIHFASASGTGEAPQIVQLLLARGQDVNLTCKNSSLNATSLHIACMNTHKISEEIVRVLLANKADINMTYGGNRRALHLTATTSDNGSVDVDLAMSKIRLFLAHGEDVNACEPTGVTLLFTASIDLNLFKRVIELPGLDIHKKFSQLPSDTQRKTIFGHFLNIVQEIDEEDKDNVYQILNILVQHGANYKEVSSSGIRLIHQACSDQCLFVMKTLLDKGEDVNVQIALHGYTCCYILCKTEQNIPKASAILRYLIKKYGADINIPDNKGHYPIFDLVMGDRAIDLDFVATYGNADLTVTTSKGLGLVHLAVYKGNVNSLRVLVQNHKISVNVPDKNGQLPVHLLSASHLCVADPSGEMLRILVAGGASVDKPRTTVDRVDHVVHMIQPHYIPFLAGLPNVDLNVLNSDGLTALQVAAVTLNGQKVRALLESGADSSIKVASMKSEYFGKTALELAEMQQVQNTTQKYIQFHIVKLLSEATVASKQQLDVDSFIHMMDLVGSSMEQEKLMKL